MRTGRMQIGSMRTGPMRAGWLCTACVCLLFADLAIAAEGSYPEKPVHIVVGFPPGTSADVIARLLAPGLSEALGQQIIVDNRPGAGSSIAAEAVARAPADGYTLLLSTTANTINPSLYKLSFDFARDLTGISLLGDAPVVLVTHPGGPATLPALIQAARAEPGVLSYASSGNGTASHLYGELFNLAAGVHLVHVPYKGSSQAVTDLLAGRVTLQFSPASTVVQQISAGKLRALAVLERRRIAALPDVPTLEESGIHGLDSGLWLGLNAPRGTPPVILLRLNREVTHLLGVPQVRRQFEGQTIEPLPSTMQEFDDFIGRDVEKWAHVVRTANVQVQ